MQEEGRDSRNLHFETRLNSEKRRFIPPMVSTAEAEAMKRNEKTALCGHHITEATDFKEGGSGSDN